MHIESLALRNFRCFGNEPVSIPINNGVTGFVGDNGAGKSAALDALKRLFSPVAAERIFRRSDVHFGPAEDSQNVDDREMVIDVVFAFDDPDKLPHVFNDIFFDAGTGALKVRVVCECHYEKAEAFEDDLETKIYTVRTLDPVPFGPDDERKSPLRGKATQFAELVYIPAHRDSMAVTRHALKNVLRRIERSADWEDDTKNQSHQFATQLEQSLNEVPAISSVVADLKSYWGQLHDGHYDADPAFSVVATDFEQLIRDLSLKFTKSPGGGQRLIEELSEGQVSLLYFALSATLHSLIWRMDEAAPESLEGFKALDFVPAALTIFALEEPENHLAPFYLPRLIALLERLNKTGSAQSFVTSHSTSILRRIPPVNVRYLRLSRETLTSTAKEIPLPAAGTDERSFLHQVILANPEIYFARLVIVGEGDSEKIVIPRVAEASGVPLDPSFVAFVPIGGRHAQHLWRLLAGLDIPHLTLLDFDLGRYQAGMGRVRNAMTWLDAAGVNVNTETPLPSNVDLDAGTALGWTHCLRTVGVYYSSYLDLDMMMIQSYPDAYAPREPYDSEKHDAKSEKISASVFGDSGPGNSELEHIGEGYSLQALYAYNALFKSNAKPASHFDGLSKLSNEQIRANCPEPLQALIARASEMLAAPAPEVDD